MTVETALLTPTEVAARLKVSKRTVQRAIERQDEYRLPAVDITPGSATRTWRVHPDELAEWLERRRNQPAAPRGTTDFPLPAAPARSSGSRRRGAGAVSVTPEMGR